MQEGNRPAGTSSRAGFCRLRRLQEKGDPQAEQKARAPQDAEEEPGEALPVPEKAQQDDHREEGAAVDPQQGGQETLGLRVPHPVGDGHRQKQEGHGQPDAGDDDGEPLSGQLVQ